MTSLDIKSTDLKSIEKQLDVLTDEFSDEKEENKSGILSGKIHIRVTQRNTRKYLTSISGFADTFDFKSFLKKNLHTNGTCITSDNGIVVQVPLRAVVTKEFQLNSF